jgi:hypothetical protein
MTDLSDGIVDRIERRYAFDTLGVPYWPSQNR